MSIICEKGAVLSVLGENFSRTQCEGFKPEMKWQLFASGHRWGCGDFKSVNLNLL